jgi:hypothetical protein
MPSCDRNDARHGRWASYHGLCPWGSISSQQGGHVVELLEKGRGFLRSRSLKKPRPVNGQPLSVQRVFFSET